MLGPLADRILKALHFPAAWDRAWAAGSLAAAMWLALATLASYLIARFVSQWLRRLAARTTTNVDDKLIEIADRPLRRIIQVVGLYLAVTELPLGADSRLFGTGAVLVAGLLVGIRLLSKVAVVLLLAYGQRVGDREGQEPGAKDYVPLLSKIVSAILVVMGLIAVLHHFGQNVASLVAALGIGGIAISFAAKETLGNMMAGFAILVDRPFRPGDRIKLATGEVGDVIEVGTRSTRLKLVDQNMLIVPNAELINTRVVNYNFPTHATSASLEVRVAYGGDVEQAKAIVLEVIRAQPEIIAPEPQVSLDRFGEFALVIVAHYTISEFADSGNVQDRVKVQVYQRFQAASIRIPYPTREIIQAK